MKITFKKKPRLTGLARIGAGPRGSDVRLDGAVVGSVSPSGGDWRGQLRGWYFAVHAVEEHGIPYVNTCYHLVGTEDEAKAAAKAWIKKHARKAVKP